MAFLPQGQQQQDQNQPGAQNQIPVIPSLAGSGGPSASQTGGTTNTASPAGAPSSPWQNVTSYLQANAGQAGNVADVLAGNLTNQYNTAHQGIQDAQQNFGQQIESGRVPLNQQMAQQAAQTPGSFAQDPNNVAAFQKMWNANYGGPQSFSGSKDYSGIQGQVQKAQTNAGLVNKGTPGLMTLLQQAESAQGRNPTQGVTALDSLLLQEAPENFTKINAAAKPFGGLTDYLSSTQQGLDTQATNAAQEATTTKNTLQNQFLGPNGVIPSWQNREAGQLQDLSKQATGYNQSLNDLLAGLNGGQGLSADQLGQLGVTQGSFGGGWNADQMKSLLGQGGVFPGLLGLGALPMNPGYMAQFYSQPNQVAQPTLANVSNPQEYADAQALNQLVGFDTGLAQAPQDYSIPQGHGGFDVGGATSALSNEMRGAGNINLSPDQASQWNNYYDLLTHGYVPSTDPSRQPVAPPPEPTPTGPDPNVPTSPSPGPGYVWNPTFGIWQDMGGSSGGGGGGGGGTNTFARPIG